MQILLLEEVGDEAFAVVCEDGFGVELDAFDGEGFVAEAHDGAGVGAALDATRAEISSSSGMESSRTMSEW